MVATKFALTSRVNNIFRPHDPHAWVLPGPGTPVEDAIFQCVKGILLLLPLGTFAHMLWDSHIKFAVAIRVNNLCSPDDPDAWVLPRPGAPGDDAIFQYVKEIFLYLIAAAAGHVCPHAVRWLQRNMSCQLGLTTFSDLMIRMHECYLDLDSWWGCRLSVCQGNIFIF